MNNIIKSLKYILVILLMYLSGNVYFMIFHYNSSVVLVFVYTLLLYFITNILKLLIFDYRKIVLLLYFQIMMMLTILLHADYNFSSYIAISIQMLIAILSTEIITISEFKKTFVNIIVFLAGVSLLFHLLGTLNPSVVSIFPKTDGVVSVDYYNAVIHVFQGAMGYEDLMFHSRNAGIFWEPGAYQAFLNIGLVFLLDNYNFDEKKKTNIKVMIIILLLAIVSTYSTTGFVIAFLILISYLTKIVDIFRIEKLSDILLILLILSLGSYYVIDEIQNAYILIEKKYIGEQGNILRRLSLDKLVLLLDFQNLFFGVSFNNKFETGAIWNSIISTAVVFGLPFATLLLYSYFKAAQFFIKNRFLFCIILLFIFSSESFFWRPIFLYIAFSVGEKK